MSLPACGSIHQGHERFSGQSRGKHMQCSLMSLFTNGILHGIACAVNSTDKLIKLGTLLSSRMATETFMTLMNTSGSNRDVMLVIRTVAGVFLEFCITIYQDSRLSGLVIIPLKFHVRQHFLTIVTSRYYYYY